MCSARLGGLSTLQNIGDVSIRRNKSQKTSCRLLARTTSSEWRISGNEPTLGRDHFLQVIALVPTDLLFILETNGILLGHDREYAAALARFPHVRVRVSQKGSTPRNSHGLTGARPAGFHLQLAALHHLVAAGANVNAAVMSSFSERWSLRALQDRLANVSPLLADLELEEVALYGDVERRLATGGLGCRRYKRRPTLRERRAACRVRCRHNVSCSAHANGPRTF